MQGTELNALVKACKYSLVPNGLGYCGAQDFSGLFASFIENPQEEKIPEIKSALRTFLGEHSYVQLIAEENGLEEFNEQAIDAYWLGSDLLECVHPKKIEKLINEKFRTLPESIRRKKIESLPEKAFPHHSFHVLFVEFLTPKLKAIVPNLDKCIVGWGKVKKNSYERLEIKGIELFSESSELKLRERTKTIENPFSLNAKKGSLVSVHWDNAIEEIDEDQAKELKKYTLKNLELANSAR